MDIRSVLRFLPAVAVAAVLTGCATQDPFGLPPLGSSGAGHGASTTVYYGYGPYAHRGYGYNPYTYYPYYYGSSYDAGAYGAHPYPPPGYLPYPSGPYCRDSNRDGRCDVARDPVDRDPDRDDANMFERLRERLDARAGSGPTTPAPVPNTVPRKAPPAPKVAPPGVSQRPTVRPDDDRAATSGQPAQRRSILRPTDEP